MIPHFPMFLGLLMSYSFIQFTFVLCLLRHSFPHDIIGIVADHSFRHIRLGPCHKAHIIILRPTVFRTCRVNLRFLLRLSCFPDGLVLFFPFLL